MNYRQKICVNVIRFPQGFAEENRGLKKECCDAELKLASSTSNDSYKNDWSGVPVKISDISDIVDIIITKCDDPFNPLPLLGEVLDCPEDELTVGYVFEWKQYLLAYGEGLYTISVQFTISGTPGGYDFGTFELKEFTIPNAAETSRVYSQFNSYLQRELMDFTNSNYKDTIRFHGFFGNREPKTEINNLISKGRKIEKVTRENLNAYTLRTDPVSICITRRLLDWHFLNEDVCKISDHNRTNHDYLLFDLPVALEETPEIEYIEGNRWAKVTAIFGDRSKLDKSYYNAK